MKKIIAETEKHEAPIIEPVVIRDLQRKNKLIFFFPEEPEILIDGESPL